MSNEKKRSYTWLFGLSIMVMLWAGPGNAQSVYDSRNDSAEDRTEQLSVQKLIRLDPRTTTFKIVKGKNEGALVSVSFSKAQANGNAWQLTFEGLYSLSLRRNAEGDITVAQMELKESGRRIVFNPDLVLAPAMITAGKTISITGTAVIYDMSTGEQTRSGSYDYTLAGLSQASLDTPAGRIDASLLQYDVRIHLDYATIRIDLESGWSDDQKLVYWRSRRHVAKLGFFGTTTLHEMALTEQGAK